MAASPTRNAPSDDAFITGRLAVYGLAYCVMHVGPTFLRRPQLAGVTAGEWLSLLAPWLVVGAAWRVWLALPGAMGPAATAPRGLFLGSGLLYALGLGVNLSANAIARPVAEFAGSAAQALTYFLDERLGHVLWHVGTIGMAVALILGARAAALEPLRPRTLAGALAYAFAYFADAVEGQTVPLMLPTSLVLVTALAAGRARSSGTARGPAGTFFTAAHVVALAFFSIWYVWQGGFPQFSELWGL